MEARSRKASKGKADLLRLDRAMAEMELSVSELHRVVLRLVEDRLCPLPPGPEEADADDDELGGA